MSRKKLLRLIRQHVQNYEDGILLETFRLLCVQAGYTLEDVTQNTTLTDMFVYRRVGQLDMAIPRARFFRTCAELFEGETPTSHSFGIEFEGGMMDKNGNLLRGGSDHAMARITKFRMQPDPTAAFEILTPAYKNFDDCTSDVGAQWIHWLKENPNALPYWKSNTLYRSMGHHIHIGKPSRALPYNEKRQIALAALPILPALYFISANNAMNTENGSIVLSKRMLTSNYCQPLNGNIVGREHYMEISDSTCGTVEFRTFDTNFPQITLTCAFLLKSAADLNAQNMPATLSQEEQRDLINKFVKIRTAVLKGSLVSFIRAREAMKQELGKVELKHQFIREVLYLSLVTAENPGLFMKRFTPKLSELMTKNPEKFLDNIREASEKKGMQHIITKMKADSENYNTIEKMCSQKIKVYSKKRMVTVWNQLLTEMGSKDGAEKVLNDYFEFPDSWLKFARQAQVKIKIKNSVVTFKRLFEVENTESQVVAEQIVTEIMSHETRELNLPITPAVRVVLINEILESQDRFYVIKFGTTNIGYAQMNLNERLIRKVVCFKPYEDQVLKILAKKFNTLTMTGSIKTLEEPLNS